MYQKRAPAGHAHLGVGRRLLGLAWRFLGLGIPENEVLKEEQVIDEGAESPRENWDFDAGMDEEEFAVQGNEFDIVEEDALELVVSLAWCLQNAASKHVE